MHLIIATAGPAGRMRPKVVFFFLFFPPCPPSDGSRESLGTPWPGDHLDCRAVAGRQDALTSTASTHFRSAMRLGSIGYLCRAGGLAPRSIALLLTVLSWLVGVEKRLYRRQLAA